MFSLLDISGSILKIYFQGSGEEVAANFCCTNVILVEIAIPFIRLKLKG